VELWQRDVIDAKSLLSEYGLVMRSHLLGVCDRYHLPSAVCDPPGHGSSVAGIVIRLSLPPSRAAPTMNA
jgi:hypothetical protein